MTECGAMQGKSFSYKLEKQYYTRALPAAAKVFAVVPLKTG